MSRSGYSEEVSEQELNLWRGAVESAIRGKRGQQCLRDLAAALDAMPTKELCVMEFEAHGEVCALGALGRARGMDMSDLYEGSCPSKVAQRFGVAEALAAEIMFINDEFRPPVGTRGADISAARWIEVRKWVESKIAPEQKPGEEQQWNTQA